MTTTDDVTHLRALLAEQTVRAERAEAERAAAIKVLSDAGLALHVHSMNGMEQHAHAVVEAYRAALAACAEQTARAERAEAERDEAQLRVEAYVVSLCDEQASAERMAGRHGRADAYDYVAACVSHRSKPPHAVVLDQVRRAHSAEREAKHEAWNTIGLLVEWSHTFGAALKPPSADTYGEGMRDAKEQVSNIIRRGKYDAPDDVRTLVLLANHLSNIVYDETITHIATNSKLLREVCVAATRIGGAK